MITPNEIGAKLEGQYKRVLQAWLRGELLFPVTLPVGQIPKKDFLELRRTIQRLREGSKETLGYGYTI